MSVGAERGRYILHKHTVKKILKFNWDLNSPPPLIRLPPGTPVLPTTIDNKW